LCENKEANTKQERTLPKDLKSKKMLWKFGRGKTVKNSRKKNTDVSGRGGK